MNRTSYIYAIINNKSKRRYVGSTVDPKSRWAHHRMELRGKRHHCRYLQNSWNKHGESTFSFAILETLETDDRQVRLRAELIAISSAPCYNSRISNIGFTNFVNSPHVRNSISAGIRKKLETDSGYRELLTAIGKKAAAFMRLPQSRAKRALLSKELWKDPNHRDSVSKSLNKHWNRPGTREEHSERVKLHRSTPEARLKNSETVKLAWADPNSGLRNRKPTRWADPQTKVRHAERMRAYHAKRRLAAQAEKSR